MIGFDPTDAAILRTLRERPQSASSIARTIGISRPTIDYRLKRLHRYKHLQRTRVSGCEWQWHPSTSREQGSAMYVTYYGDDIARAYSGLKSLPKGSMIYALHGTKHVALTAEKYLTYHTRDIRNTYHRRGIFIRNLIGEGIGAINAATVKKHPQLFTRINSQRVEENTIYPHPSFKGPGAYIVTKKFVMAINEQRRTAIVIRDRALVDMLYETMRLLFSVLDHADNIRHEDIWNTIRKALEARA